MACLKLSNLSNKCRMFRNWKRFALLFIDIFNSIKSEMNLTVPFILGIVKVGAVYWEKLIFFHTPILINQ